MSSSYVYGTGRRKEAVARVRLLPGDGSIVALLLEAGRGRLAPGSVAELLDADERALHGRAAPARGLTLERVIYSNTGSTATRSRKKAT